MSEKLLPCPLCGECPVLTEAMTEHWVSCGTCGASGGMHGRLKLAVEAWNRRTPAPEGEVVAWQVRTSCGQEGFLAEVLSDSARAALAEGGYSVQALYASTVVPVGVSEAVVPDWAAAELETAYAHYMTPGVASSGVTIGGRAADAILAALRPTDTGRE